MLRSLVILGNRIHPFYLIYLPFPLIAYLIEFIIILGYNIELKERGRRMKSFLHLLENDWQNCEEITKAAKILNASYNPFMSDQEIWELLHALFPKKLCSKLKEKLEGHLVVNEILMKYYTGEKVIKYFLAKERLNISDEITIFEFPINSSRLDVGRINGQSYVYEIKTEYDSLNKLSKQIEDYSKAFEYVYTIVHPKHIDKTLETVPQYCGIQTYTIEDGEFEFKKIRQATYSPCLDSYEQLKTLSSKDLETILKEEEVRNIPATKNERYKMLIDVVSDEKVNEHFKWVIKNKFSQRWEYLCENFRKIHPIDIQAFYQTAADPYWIYYKNSSMV